MNVVNQTDELLIDRQQLRYELDDGPGHRARIGVIVLATDHSLEYEFRRMLNVPGVAFYESRIPNSATVTKEALGKMAASMTQAADLILPGMDLDVVAYGCTSASMVIGFERIHAEIRKARPGVACTTPMEAVFAALKTLNAKRICFIAPYSDDINRSMRAFLQEYGFEVPVMGSWNLTDDNTIARISPRSIREAILELGSSAVVDAVFLSCTNLRLADDVETLEQELGKPVTASNHALAWHCLRLAGIDDPVAGYGRLFRLGLNPA